MVVCTLESTNQFCSAFVTCVSKFHSKSNNSVVQQMLSSLYLKPVLASWTTMLFN